MKNAQRFKNMFLIALPMYLFGLLILVIATLINPLWINLIFLLVGPFFHLALSEFKSPFEEKLEWMTDNMSRAITTEDPIKQSMQLSMAAMKNANICAMLSDRDTENHNHWRIMYTYYNDLRMIHREAFVELMNDKNKS